MRWKLLVVQIGFLFFVLAVIVMTLSVEEPPRTSSTSDDTIRCMTTTDIEPTFRVELDGGASRALCLENFGHFNATFQFIYPEGVMLSGKLVFVGPGQTDCEVDASASAEVLNDFENSVSCLTKLASSTDLRKHTKFCSIQKDRSIDCHVHFTHEEIHETRTESKRSTVKTNPENTIRDSLKHPIVGIPGEQMTQGLKEHPITRNSTVRRTDESLLQTAASGNVNHLEQQGTVRTKTSSNGTNDSLPGVTDIPIKAQPNAKKSAAIGSRWEQQESTPGNKLDVHGNVVGSPNETRFNATRPRESKTLGHVDNIGKSQNITVKQSSPSKVSEEDPLVKSGIRTTSRSEHVSRETHDLGQKVPVQSAGSSPKYTTSEINQTLQGTESRVHATPKSEKHQSSPTQDSDQEQHGQSGGNSPQSKPSEIHQARESGVPKITGSRLHHFGPTPDVRQEPGGQSAENGTKTTTQSVIHPLHGTDSGIQTTAESNIHQSGTTPDFHKELTGLSVETSSNSTSAQSEIHQVPQVSGNQTTESEKHKQGATQYSHQDFLGRSETYPSSSTNKTNLLGNQQNFITTSPGKNSSEPEYAHSAPNVLHPNNNMAWFQVAWTSAVVVGSIALLIVALKMSWKRHQPYNILDDSTELIEY